MRAMRTARRAGRARLLAGGMAAVLVLTACGDQASGSDAVDNATEGVADGNADAGVEYGASMEEYQAALEDMEPVTIVAQTPGGEGTVSSERFEQYFDAVEEWSDGKIQFDVTFANAIAPPTEIDDAVQDGRLDLGSSLPLYEPDQYPANNALVDLTFLGSQTPIVGPLQLLAWTVETGLAVPEVEKEMAERDLHVLLPIFQSGSASVMCATERTTLEDFRGATSTASSRVHEQELGALGVTPVSIAFTEFFESLQRGVVDCSTTSLLVGILGGLFEVAPNVVVDPEAGFAVGAGTLVMNANQWTELPLAAQQLLHDRLDVFIEAGFRSTFDSVVEAVTQVQDFGGQVQPFGDEARQVLLEANDQIVEDAKTSDDVAQPEKLVSTAVESSEAWYSRITEELGYDDELTYTEFPTWYAENEVDLQPYLDTLFDEVLNEYRPG